MTTLTSKQRLTRLGAGESIDAICAADGVSRQQFNAWWREECRHRVPPMDGSRRVPGLRGPVRIDRDEWGIPHVFADNDADLFFGASCAIATHAKIAQIVNTAVTFIRSTLPSFVQNIKPVS